MNSLATFREMYRDAQDNVIGDPNEGKLVIHEAVMFIEGSSRPQVIHDQALSTAGENDFVFCMYGVNSEKRATSAALQSAISEWKRRNPFIGKLIDGSYEGTLSEEQSAALIRFIDLYMKLEEMERMHLYFRGHTDAFAYLKKINVI